MRAVRHTTFGGPEVLSHGWLPEPHAGPGQIRIAVRATSVNPYDLKKRSGTFGGTPGGGHPLIPGVEAAGVVDEVGEGVTTVAAGDPVFGLGTATSAEFAVLDHFAHKPDVWDWAQAASVSTTSEAALRSLDLLDICRGQTLLVDGAGGGVGSAVVQFATDAGLTVIGTDLPAKQGFLRSLGAVPLVFGPELPARVAALAPAGVDRALDVSGRGSLADLIAITGDAAQVLSIANFSAAEFGVRVTSQTSAFHALKRAADLAADGRLKIAVDSTYPLEEAAAAHARAESGAANGKVVLVVAGAAHSA